MTHAPENPTRRWPLRVMVMAAVCLILVLTPAGPAAAHTTLIATDPDDGVVLAESPDQASLTFNEPVTLPEQGVQVFDAQGEPVSSSASASDAVVTVDLPQRLSEGTYVVAWRVISADGHPVGGSLTFSVGMPSASVASPATPAAESSTVTTALSAAHAVSYLGLLLAVGLGIFSVVVLPADVRAARPRRWMRHLFTAAAGTSIIASLLALPLTAVNQQGLKLARLVSSTAWTGIRAEAIISFAMMTAGLIALSVAIRGRPSSRPTRVALGLGVALAAVAPALTGHTRAYEPQLLVILIDILHVLAGSVWFGGLVGLVLTLPASSGRRADAARALSRFSTLAAGVLAVLVGTGLVLAWRILGSWENLFGTRYGWLLLTKIAMVATAAVIAAWNRFVLLPRAERAASEPEHRDVTTRLGRVVTVESVVLVMALVFTGFLVNQSPEVEAREEPGTRALEQHAELGEEVKVMATLSPGRVGQNTLTIQLEDLTGKAPKTNRPPALSLESDDVDLGRIPAVAEANAAATFSAHVVIPSAGRWRLQVSVRLGEFENPVATVSFTVKDKEPR